MGVSGKAYGFNRQSAANTADGSVSIKDTSPDREYLDELARTQEEFSAASITVRHLERYDSGQWLGWRGARCVLNKGTKQSGREAEAQNIEYPIRVIGYEDVYKET